MKLESFSILTTFLRNIVLKVVVEAPHEQNIKKLNLKLFDVCSNKTCKQEASLANRQEEKSHDLII